MPFRRDAYCRKLICSDAVNSDLKGDTGCRSSGCSSRPGHDKSFESETAALFEKVLQSRQQRGSEGRISLQPNLERIKQAGQKYSILYLSIALCFMRNCLRSHQIANNDVVALHWKLP